MQTHTHDVAPDQILAGDLSLERALGAVVGSGSPICVVRDGDGGHLGLLERSVRNAWQDQPDATRTLAELASRELVLDGRDAAERRLSDHPQWPGVVVDSGDGKLSIVEREVPRIRTAIVMAGGFGTRLRPLTEATPKPLLDVGGRPLVARILDLLQRHGVERLYVSVHYMADQVEALIGDGSAWEMEASYLREDTPLGTGAGIAQLTGVDEPFFLMNGDILTNTSLTAMAREHLLQQNLATVATFLFPAPLPYGVVHYGGDRIASIEEKPVFRYPVNAGVYAFDSRVLERIEHGHPLAMVDLLNDCARSERIGRFALVEYWNDIGSHADYERANEDVDDL